MQSPFILAKAGIQTDDVFTEHLDSRFRGSEWKSGWNGA